MITEAKKKSYNMPCASWRTREATGIVQYESNDLRTRGSGDVTQLEPKA